jgi:fructoselysine 6-kinase
LSGVVTVGDNVADVYPSLKSFFPGGNAVNVAVAARRSGVDAAYVGAVGTDEVGRAIRAALEDEDVGTDRLRVVDGPSAYCVVELAGGDRHFLGSDLGVSEFTLDGTDLEYLSGFDCVHTGDCSGTEEQLGDLAAAARLSFDFSDRPSSYCEPLLDKVWLACFSGTRLAEGEVTELAKRVLRAGPEVVLVTEGPRGASLFTAAGEAVHVETATTAPADTLGAGDAVIGSVLAGMLLGEDLEKIMSSAMLLAAGVCQHHGGFGHGQTYFDGEGVFPERGHLRRRSDEVEPRA